MSDPVILRIIPDGPDSPGEGSEAGSLDGELPLTGGDRLTGRVEVEVHDDLEFNAFRIGFLWHTEGKGNRVSGTGGGAVMATDGRWTAGERISFPFSLTVPPGPVSYTGRKLRVVWDLEARVERSMLHHDFREGLPVHLDGDPEGREYDLGPRPQKKSELEAVKRGLGGVWLTAGVLVLVGSIIFGVIRSWDFHGLERWLLFLLILGGFLLSLKGIWGRLGRGKLGEPTVQLSTTGLRRGEEIRFGLVLRPEQRTELRSLEVILECEERVVHGHGQYQSHHRKTVFERRLSLAKDLMVEPHRGLRKKGSLIIPEDAPTTFGAPSNQVVWWLRFEGDIVGWPDWNEPFLLTVRP